MEALKEASSRGVNIIIATGKVTLFLSLYLCGSPPLLLLAHCHDFTLFPPEIILLFLLNLLCPSIYVAKNYERYDPLKYKERHRGGVKHAQAWAVQGWVTSGEEGHRGGGP